MHRMSKKRKNRKVKIIFGIEYLDLFVRFV